MVSVIMPAFNTGRWIDCAIRSALNQTLTEVEVLVVDDRSTADTVAIVQSIKDDRVRLIRQPENRGVSAARNLALDRAQGTWAAILDSDDWFARRDRLARLVALGEERNADLVADDLYLVEDGKDYAWGTMLSEKGLRLGGPTLVDLWAFVKHDLGPIKPVVRMGFLREHGLRYDEGLRMVEDWPFYVECLLAGARLVLAPEPGYCYRIRSGSLSRTPTRLLAQLEANLTRYLNDVRVLAQPELVRLLHEERRKVRSNRRGLSARSLELRAGSPQAARLYYRELAETVEREVPVARRLREYANFARFSLHGRVSIPRQAREARLKVLWATAAPVGVMLYLRDLVTLRARGRGNR